MDLAPLAEMAGVERGALERAAATVRGAKRLGVLVSLPEGHVAVSLPVEASADVPAGVAAVSPRLPEARQLFGWAEGAMGGLGWLRWRTAVATIDKRVLLDLGRCVDCKSCSAACFYGHRGMRSVAFAATPEATVPIVCRQPERTGLGEPMTDAMWEAVRRAIGLLGALSSPSGEREGSNAAPGKRRG